MLKNNRKYRFGFFGHLSGASVDYGKADFLLDWEKRVFGELTLFTHPETTVQCWNRGQRQVVVIGTIYSVGADSIELVVDRMLQGGSNAIGRLLDEVSGRFALLFSDEVGWRVFNDAFGSRSMFYSPDRQGVVASHSGILAEIFDLAPNEQTKAFMESPIYQSRTVQYLPGDLTCWARVYAVIPNNYLDLGRSRLVRYWPTVPKKDFSYEDFFEQFDCHIKGLLEAVKNKFLLVGITGGIDSRAVFAAMLRYSVPFNGVTWLGGYIDKKEMDSVAEIVRRFNIPYKEFAVSGRGSDPMAKLAAENSGAFRKPSSLVATMYQKYRDVDGVFVRGYGGEIIRGFYSSGSKSPEVFSARQMMAAYSSSNRAKEPVPDEYNRFGEMAFNYYLIRGNYKDIDRFGFDFSDIFYWEHRMGMWGSAMLNEMDCAAYSLVGMNGRRLYETALGLKHSERLSKKILARIVKDYDKDLSSIKFW